MPEKNYNAETEEFLRDLPLRAEEIGFKPAEMIECRKCARANAPTRLKCMYCGADLEIAAERAGRVKPNLRKLETFEPGFNLIYLPGDRQISGELVRQTARSLGLEAESLQRLLEARRPLPVMRCETGGEAAFLQNRLREAGITTSIVADEQLAADVSPKRLRALEFRDRYIFLTLFNKNEIEAVDVENLKVIVTGAIFQREVEATEARKKGESKILHATETASDESLIDLYTAGDALGYRILTKGFDFSCLGAEKGIVAHENIKRLIGKLQRAAPAANFVDDYLKVRNLLGAIWELEERKDSQGLTRHRIGKFELNNVTSSSNLRQFTKYSRLQRHLL
ncbi:MAG TPA: hypothetical protein VIL74_17015 [Pyrinomonadaceae bacterium]|jgi:hypothetical protein